MNHIPFLILLSLGGGFGHAPKPQPNLNQEKGGCEEQRSKKAGENGQKYLSFHE